MSLVNEENENSIGSQTMPKGATDNENKSNKIKLSYSQEVSSFKFTSITPFSFSLEEYYIILHYKYINYVTP